MAEAIILDPAAVAAPGRTQLDITNWIKAPDGVDWGDAEMEAYMADLDMGSSPVDSRLPNRDVEIPLVLKAIGGTSHSAIRSSFRRKVGLMQRERGTLLRTDGAIPLYGDVQTASLHLGGDWVQAYRDIDVNAVLKLAVLPDLYGDEIVLDTLTGTNGVLSALLKASGANAVIGGDYPARCRLVFTDTSAQDQKSLLWALQAAKYDSAPSAALTFEADLLTGVNAAASAALTGASGGNAMKLTNPPLSSWVSMLYTNIASGNAPLTHKGTYRVFARCYSSNGVPSFRLQWGVGSLSVPTTNDPIVLPGPGAFYLLDLGQVRLDPSPVGTHQWFGIIQAYTSTVIADAQIDALYLVPVDESASKLTYTKADPPSSIGSWKDCTTGSDNAGIGTVAWTNPANIGLNETSKPASLELPASGISHYLLATGLGFTIPSTATIRGVAGWIGHYTTGSDQKSGGVQDWAIRLVKGGVVQATDRSVTKKWAPKAWEWFYYGSATDMWGTSLLYSDANASNFGLAISAKNLDASSQATVLLANAGLAIFYTLASGITVVQDAIIYASQITEVRTDGTYRSPGSSIYGRVGDEGWALPRIPPSGMEGRNVRLFAKPSRGDLDQLADAGLDSFTVQVRYRPCYLGKP